MHDELCSLLGLGLLYKNVKEINLNFQDSVSYRSFVKIRTIFFINDRTMSFWVWDPMFCKISSFWAFQKKFVKNFHFIQTL